MARSRRGAVLDDFRFRKERGFGHYLTREDVKRRNPVQVSDLFREVPGLRVESGRRPGSSGMEVRLSHALRAPGRTCPLQLFVYGVLAREAASRAGGVVVDGYATPSEVVGIGIYRGLGSVPAELAVPDARCGVIALWTRRTAPGSYEDGQAPGPELARDPDGRRVMPECGGTHFGVEEHVPTPAPLRRLPKVLTAGLLLLLVAGCLRMGPTEPDPPDDGPTPDEQTAMIGSAGAGEVEVVPAA